MYRVAQLFQDVRIVEVGAVSAILLGIRRRVCLNAPLTYPYLGDRIEQKRNGMEWTTTRLFDFIATLLCTSIGLLYT